MNEDFQKSINLKEMHDLIDLYKYASIGGEKVEFIVYPTKDGKRVITIGLQNGFSRDRDTFIFDDGDKFDKEIYPDLLAYFTCDDSLSNWDITVPEIEDVTIKGVNETQSGNIVYLDTNNKELYDNLEKEVEEVKEETTYKKDNLTNEDKIWDEILLYAKGRKVTQDFFVGSDLMDEEIRKVYDFIANLSEEKAINIGTSKKARNNNEKYLTELLKDKSVVKKYAPLFDDTIDSLNNPGMIRKLAKLVGAEKRIRKRVDISNEEIKNKISFAVSQLDKVEYFSLKNGSIKQFEDKEFVESKPKAIKKLIELYGNEPYYENTKYKDYCYELLEYLERKANNGKKVKETKKNEEEITFKEYNETVVDSYEKLEEAIDLIKDARIDNERYEFVLDFQEEKAKLRIDLIDGATRSDVFEFMFTNKEEAIEKIRSMTLKLFQEDPKNKTRYVFVEHPEKEETITELDTTKEGNEILVKGLKLEPKEEMVKVLEKEPPQRTFDGSSNVSLDSLHRLEKQISDYMLEQEEKENDKKEEKGIEYDLNLATYQLLVDKYQNNLEDKFYNNELLFDEYEVVHKVYKLKDELLDYYNENYDKLDKLSKEQMSKFSKAELYLTTIYNIEAKYKDNNKRISELKEQDNLIPAGKSLLNTFEKNESSNNNFLNEIVDVNIKTYKEITEKYGGNINEIDSEEANKDKSDLLKIITYKLKLVDLYNSLLLKNEPLTEDELINLADYETKLYKINEIDAKYQDNLYATIKELKNNKEFLLPSSKLWLNALENERDLESEIERKKSMDLAETEAKSTIRGNIELKDFNYKEKLEDLKNNLFEIVEQEKEVKKPDYVEDIRNAYDDALTYSSKESPLHIKVDFNKENKNEAEVIISNKVGPQDIVLYQRTMTKEELDNGVMNELINIYAKDNHIEYNIKFNISGTNDYCLLMVGDERKTFNIVNASSEYVDENKKHLEELMQNKEDIKTK